MVDATPNELFLGLISSLQMSAWMQLGKMMNPMTGKIEREMQHAQESIDLLGMLEEKTRGNLHPDEARLLSRILFDLRMNYVEEVNKDRAPVAAPAAASVAPKSATESGSKLGAASVEPLGEVPGAADNAVQPGEESRSS